MSFPQGVYFRATDNQSDPTNYDASIGATYPQVSAQGNNVGWDSFSPSTRDRDVTTDVRLKGVAFNGQSNPLDFIIELPATGAYKARVAMGDTSAGHNCRVKILDTSALLQDSDAGDVPSSQFGDATGVVRTSESDWVNNNALTGSLTFATTVCRFRFGNSAGANGDPNWVACAAYIEAAGGGASTFGPIIKGGTLTRGLVRGGRLVA